MLKYSLFWARMFRYLHVGGQGNGSTLCSRNHQYAEPCLGWESVAAILALLRFGSLIIVYQMMSPSQTDWLKPSLSF